MQINNTQKSILESKVVQIPIEKFEEDLDTELAKEKKQEILDIFINHNNLSSDLQIIEMHFILQISNRFIFHQRFQKYVSMHFLIAKISHLLIKSQQIQI